MSTDREREALERMASEERIVHEWSLAVRLYRRGTRLGRKIALAIADALEADGVTEADIDRLFILERIVAEADRNPFNPIGHVIEHVVPEARAFPAPEVTEDDGKAGDCGDDAFDASGYLSKLRSEGWRVAVHNDYRQHGQDWTFWLLTHPSGLWCKGEGVSDALALDQAFRNARAVLGKGGAHE